MSFGWTKSALPPFIFQSDPILCGMNFKSQSIRLKRVWNPQIELRLTFLWRWLFSWKKYLLTLNHYLRYIHCFHIIGQLCLCDQSELLIIITFNEACENLFLQLFENWQIFKINFCSPFKWICTKKNVYFYKILQANP